MSQLVERKKRKLQHNAMIVGEGGSSEKGHLMLPEVLMEVAPRGSEASRTGLDRQFPAEHREVMLCLMLQPQVSEGYVARGRWGWSTRLEPGPGSLPEVSGRPVGARERPSLIGICKGSL